MNELKAEKFIKRMVSTYWKKSKAPNPYFFVQFLIVTRIDVGDGSSGKRVSSSVGYIFRHQEIMSN